MLGVGVLIHLAYIYIYICICFLKGTHWGNQHPNSMFAVCLFDTYRYWGKQGSWLLDLEPFKRLTFAHDQLGCSRWVSIADSNLVLLAHVCLLLSPGVGWAGRGSIIGALFMKAAGPTFSVGQRYPSKPFERENMFWMDSSTGDETTETRLATLTCMPME